VTGRTGLRAGPPTSDVIVTVDPATGDEIARYATFDDAEIEAALSAGHDAAMRWAATPLAQRLRLLAALADALRAGRHEFAALITKEMGKPIAESLAEIDKCAATADHYVRHAEAVLAPEPVEVDGSRAWVGYEPLGLILAVMPWNFPFWQVLRFALPTLAAGNAVLLKHSPNVTGCALAIERLVRAAGLPDKLVTTLVVAEPDVPVIAERVIADDRIAAVTLTGSNRAGAAVGAAAGRAVKKAVLELGGSDPFVVLDDADLDAASTAAVRSRFLNSGQSCVCAKRILVAEPVAEQFTRMLVEKTEALVVGDPADPATRIGPLARPDLRDNLHAQVLRTIEQGGRLLTGGRLLDGPGNYYAPTLLGGVRPGMTAFDEETFGPVAALAVGADDDRLVELANASRYGLGLSVWSADTDRALRVARRITSGAAFVNAIVASDPRVPFGGAKQSGHGRELAAAGLREFCLVRTYWVADPLAEVTAVAVCAEPT
jgi:acyl-CoA reductase-like NAD-dependent aldehyde dehydrogenase